MPPREPKTRKNNDDDDEEEVLRWERVSSQKHRSRGCGVVFGARRVSFRNGRIQQRRGDDIVIIRCGGWIFKHHFFFFFFEDDDDGRTNATADGGGVYGGTNKRDRVGGKRSASYVRGTMLQRENCVVGEIVLVLRSDPVRADKKLRRSRFNKRRLPRRGV